LVENWLPIKLSIFPTNKKKRRKRIKQDDQGGGERRKKEEEEEEGRKIDFIPYHRPVSFMHDLIQSNTKNKK
jgi:hypothetical protein